MFRVLFTPRWLGLHLLTWILIPSFIGLGIWQENRHFERRAENHTIAVGLRAAPIPLDSVDSVDGTIPATLRYHQIRVSGHYDPAHEFLARDRAQNGDPGYYVVTPFVVDGGDAAILINRGWIPTGTSVIASPPVPTPPAGDVTLIGRLEPSETTKATGIHVRGGLPAGQIMLISTSDLGPKIGTPLYGGFLDLVSESPEAANAPQPLPTPTMDAGPYLSYWIQWWLFTAVTFVTWIMLMRREIQDQRAAHAAAAPPEPGPEDDIPLQAPASAPSAADR